MGSQSGVPATPTGLMLTVVDNTTIMASWDAVSGATYYEYKIGTSVVGLGSVGWNRVMAGTSFTAQNLTPNTEYFVIVRAGNSSGTSSPTSPASATTSTPSDGPATPTGLMLTVVDHATIMASWDAVSGATYYQYKFASSVVGLGAAGWNRVMQGTSFTVQNLSPNTEYFAVVRAGDADGTSDPTGSVSATTSSVPINPSYNDFTFIGSLQSSSGDLMLEPPNVTIFPPIVSEDPTQLEWSIGFTWTQDVEDFYEEHIVFSGDDTGVTVKAFAGGGRDYTCTIVLPANVKGSLFVSIEANTVTGTNGLKGPPDPVMHNIDYNTQALTLPTNVLCKREFINSLNPDVERNLGGVFRNIFACEILGNYLYFVCQLQRYGGLYGQRHPLGQITFLDNNATSYIQARANLYRVNLNTCEFELIKRYRGITTAPRSLKEWNGRIYGIEGSHYNYLNDGLVLNRQTGAGEYTRSRFREVDKDWKKNCGQLFSIDNTESELTYHGLWSSAKPIDNPDYDQTDVDAFYGINTGTASPILAYNDGLTLITGFGDYTRVAELKTDPVAPVNDYKNLTRLRYNRNVNMSLPVVQTNQRSSYEIIREICRLTNSIMFFDGETFKLKPRDQSEPTPQYTLELNAYTLEKPINRLTPSTDIANLYNSIVINYNDDGEYRKKLDDSIATHGKKEFAMTVPLGSENLEWIRWLADAFLNRFGKVRHIVVAQLKFSFHIKLGDVVEIIVPDRVHLDGNYQVIQISHLLEEQVTEVSFVSLSGS